jgi:hypothetical protein
MTPRFQLPRYLALHDAEISVKENVEDIGKLPELRAFVEQVDDAHATVYLLMVTFRIGDLVVIEQEAPSKCALCGEIAETRPYGPGGVRVCFSCGMRDSEATRARAAKILFDVDPSESN